MRRTFATLLLASLLIGTETASLADPIPEYLGVYALTNGKLVELSPHPQSGMSGIEVMGAGIWRGLSGPVLGTGNVEFIVYLNHAASMQRIAVHRVARVARSIKMKSWGISETTSKSLDDAYVPTEGRVSMRVAPMEENPSMLIKASPPKELSPGIWALNIGNKYYDFVVGSIGAAECWERVQKGMDVSYRLCNPSPSDQNGTTKTISRSDTLAGPVKLLSTSKLRIKNKVIELWGIEGQGNQMVREMGRFISEQGNFFKCKQVGQEDRYRCESENGIDLAEAALLNGAATTASTGSERYEELERKAKEEGRGIWKE